MVKALHCNHPSTSVQGAVPLGQHTTKGDPPLLGLFWQLPLERPLQITEPVVGVDVSLEALRDSPRRMVNTSSDLVIRQVFSNTKMYSQVQIWLIHALRDGGSEVLRPLPAWFGCWLPPLKRCV